MHNEWRRKEDGFWEWSQSFHVHTTTECLPVSAGCSRILHAANVASAGDCSSLFFSLSHQLLLLFPSPGVITIPLIQLLSNLIWFSPLCRSLFLSVFIQLFHWLADSLFINLMQFAHIHSALCFSSLVVENYWGGFSAGQTVTHRDPTKEKSAISHCSIYKGKNFKMFLLTAFPHPCVHWVLLTPSFLPFTLLFVLSRSVNEGRIEVAS